MNFDFDLDEFLAYLLPGSLIVVFAHIIFSQDATLANSLKFTSVEPESVRTLVSIAAYMTASLAAGHIASIWNRAIVQSATRLVSGDPESGIFGDSDKSFYTLNFRKLIQAKFREIFKVDLSTPALKTAAPQMIRAYVLKNVSAAAAVRDRVVRARSLCGNLTLPIILFSAMCFAYSQIILGICLVVTAIALAVKQHILDQREYRTINSFFIAK